MAINWLRQSGFLLRITALLNANSMFLSFTATCLPLSLSNSTFGVSAIKVMTLSSNASLAVNVAASATAFSAHCSLRERN